MTENNHAILVVEDELDVAELISMHLSRAGLRSEIVPTAESALEVLTHRKFRMLIVDWMLPGLSGLELIRTIRQSRAASFSDLPIVMVTARASSTDMVLGLEMGANDFLMKPFEPSVFLARIKALLRRASSQPGIDAPARIYRHEMLEVDLDRFETRCAGEPVELTPTEFKVLTALIEARGRVLPRRVLIERALGAGTDVTDRTIDTHIFTLRKKLRACGDAVETIRGAGYRIRA